MFKIQKLFNLLYFTIFNNSLNNCCCHSFQSSFITLSEIVLKRRLNVSNHTVINRDSDISNFCNSRNVSLILVKYGSALLILILWYVMLCLFDFSWHDFCWTLLLYNNIFNVLPIFDLIFNKLELIFQSFVLIFKIFEIVKLFLICLFNSTEFKLVSLNIWFELKHLILASLLFF